MAVDTSRWSGEGAFTQVVIDQLAAVPEIAQVRVEDAPASRSEADYNFVSNEIFVTFSSVPRTEPHRRWGFLPGSRTVSVKTMSMATLETMLASVVEVGPPDYSDEGMMQYLRTERVVPPYQTRGIKIVELVRIYDADRSTPPASKT